MVVSLEHSARSCGFHSFPRGVCDWRSQAQSVHSHPDLAELCCFDRDRTREDPRPGLKFLAMSAAYVLGQPLWEGATARRVAGNPEVNCWGIRGLKERSPMLCSDLKTKSK